MGAGNRSNCLGAMDRGKGQDTAPAPMLIRWLLVSKSGVKDVSVTIGENSSKE